MSDEANMPSEELHDVAAEMGGTFPPPRAGTELHLLDVHPHRAHAYWHIDADDMATARERAGNSPLVIRVHDVTGIAFDGKNPHDTNDTVVHSDQGHADLNIHKTGRTYLAEIGIRRADGHLERLAVSDSVEMQPQAGRHTSDHHEEAPPNIRELARIELAGLFTPPAKRPEPFARVEPWPGASELAALVPDRSEYVEAWYDTFSAHGAAIAAAQKQIEEEVASVPFVELPPQTSLRLDLLVAVPLVSAAASEVAAIAPAPVPVSSSTPQVIRLEDYLCGHSGGPASEDVLVSAELLIHGRIPRGRRATLFGKDVIVNDNGEIEVTCELPRASENLAELLPNIRPPQD